MCCSLSSLSVMAGLLLLTHVLTVEAGGGGNTTNNTVTEKAGITALYGSTTTVSTSVVPAVVSTLAVISGCGLLGLAIAKLGDWCYDRRMATRDDISNASEYTKNILRTRLAIMKMKADPAADEEKAVKAAASAWIGTTVSNKDKHSKESASESTNNKQAETGKQETNEDVEAGRNTTSVTNIAEGTEPVDPYEQGVSSNALFDPPPTIVTPTDVGKVGAPLPSPLINNKVFPVPSSVELHDETPKTRANVLPPIRSPLKSINQPIRSTR